MQAGCRKGLCLEPSPPPPHPPVFLGPGGAPRKGSAGSGEARASILCPSASPLGGGERSPSPLGLGGLLPRREAGRREGEEEGARVRPCVRPSPCAMTVERGAGEEGPPPGGRPGLLGIGCRNPSPEVAPPPWACLLLLLCGGNRCTQTESSCEQGGRAPAGRLAKGSNPPRGALAGLGNGKGPEQDLVPGLQISPGATTLGQHPRISSHLCTSFLD